MAPTPATPHNQQQPTSKSKVSTLKSSFVRPVVTPSTQFAPTPRFTFGSTQRTKNEAKTPQTQYSSPLNRRPIFVQSPQEEIEEASSEPEDCATFDTSLPIRSPDHKRRRTGVAHPKDDVIIVSSSPPASPTTPPFSPPQTPTHVHSPHDVQPAVTDQQYNHQAPPHPTPRFRLPPSTPFPPRSTQAQHPSSTLSSIPTRPPLILPPRSPSPELTQSAFFSPSRRGQQYIPGGLAATVRNWVVEAGDRGALARGRERRVTVGSVEKGERGALMIWAAVKGETNGGKVSEGEEAGEGEDGDGVRWLLIGGDGRWTVREGDQVRIREPTWEVDLEGKKWKVGVDWRVVDGGKEGRLN